MKKTNAQLETELKQSQAWVALLTKRLAIATEALRQIRGDVDANATEVATDALKRMGNLRARR